VTHGFGRRPLAPKRAPHRHGEQDRRRHRHCRFASFLLLFCRGGLVESAAGRIRHHRRGNWELRRLGKTSCDRRRGSSTLVCASEVRSVRSLDSSVMDSRTEGGSAQADSRTGGCGSFNVVAKRAIQALPGQTGRGRRSAHESVEPMEKKKLGTQVGGAARVKRDCSGGMKPGVPRGVSTAVRPAPP